MELARWIYSEATATAQQISIQDNSRPVVLRLCIFDSRFVHQHPEATHCKETSFVIVSISIVAGLPLGVVLRASFGSCSMLCTLCVLNFTAMVGVNRTNAEMKF